MENRIVQLKETEYDELKEKASVTDSQIKELAEKYYQERGVCELIITQQVKDYYGGYRRYQVDSICFENALSKQCAFKPIISEKNRKRINSLAEKIVRGIFEENYGKNVDFLNEVYKERKLFRLVKYVLYGIALSGWGLAGGMIACIIFK